LIRTRLFDAIQQFGFARRATPNPAALATHLAGMASKKPMSRSHFRTILLPMALIGTLGAQNQPKPTGLGDAVPDLAAPENAPARTAYDPLLDLPPLPKNRVTLIGGTIAKLDSVQNKMTIRPFGNGKSMRVIFDTRTNLLRNGVMAHERDLRLGDRVYLDTMLNGTQVFAKTIWIQAGAPTGDGRGQVLDYDTRAGLITVRDELSQQPVRFRLTPATVVKDSHQTGTISELAPGTLVSMTFGPQQDRYGTVREISVLARPGTSFSFFGKITFMDLSKRMFAIDNNTDGKNYEIHLEDVPQGSLRGLLEGSVVGVSAVFDGHHYVATSVARATPKPTLPDDENK